MKTDNYQSMSFVEYGVYNYPAGLEGWRFYRIEYGGHAQSCLLECHVWLPPGADVCRLEDLFDDWQSSRAEIIRRRIDRALWSIRQWLWRLKWWFRRVIEGRANI